MADLSDITAYLESTATSAVYPNGTTLPSVAAMDVRIFQGWPNPEQLDRDVAGNMLSNTNPQVVVPRPNGPASQVSIFPMQGMNASVYQIQDETYVISPAVFGLAATLVGQVITITGNPTAGEYITILADRTHVYSRSGASASAIISSLAADIAVNYPGVTFNSTSITMPNTFALVVRQGAVATMGKVTHRQKQSIMVSIWAPNNRARSELAAAIDIAIKNSIRVSMPDTSQAIICYNRTNVSDDKQMSTIYRRDLIYDAEYATVYQFPGYVITSVNTSIANYNNSSVVPAIT